MKFFKAIHFLDFPKILKCHLESHFNCFPTSHVSSGVSTNTQNWNSEGVWPRVFVHTSIIELKIRCQRNIALKSQFHTAHVVICIENKTLNSWTHITCAIDEILHLFNISGEVAGTQLPVCCLENTSIEWQNAINQVNHSSLVQSHFCNKKNQHKHVS